MSSTSRIGMVWLALLVVACNDDVYEACEVPEDCEPPDGRSAACVYKDNLGFCSWHCSTDPDCNIDDGIVYLCTPFEENPDKYCLPSCEAGQACPEDYECRSTGGGAENRMVCFPIF